MEKIYTYRGISSMEGTGFEFHTIMKQSLDGTEIGYCDWRARAGGRKMVVRAITDRYLIVPFTIKDKKQAAKEFAMAEMDRALSFNTGKE